MTEVFLQGGKMMWPLTVIGLGVLWLTAKTVWLVKRPEAETFATEQSLQAILFWGGMGVVLGFLGTVLGWIQMTRAIAVVETVEPTTLWVGIGVTFTTLTFGVLIFAISTVSWFVLRQWAGRSAAGKPA
jgi:hypothetical protein